MAVDRHPDAEQLAEYAEGALAGADRAEVEQHLAACDDCRAVVVDTMDYLATEREAPDSLQVGDTKDFPAAERPAAGLPRVLPFRSLRDMRGVAAALATAAIIALAAYVARPWLGFGPRGGRPELQELIAAQANE